MFTLIDADEDDEDDAPDEIEAAQLYCAFAGLALSAGLDREKLIALLDAEIERGPSELN